VPGRAAAKNLWPLCLFLLSVFADTFRERNKHAKHFKNTIPFCKSIKRRQAFHFSVKMPTVILYFLRVYPSVPVAIKKRRHGRKIKNKTNKQTNKLYEIQ
jgi:hypothetical protein